MTSLAWLIPAALTLGGLGLAAFLWSLKTNQYEDLEGAAWRALDDTPLHLQSNESVRANHCDDRADGKETVGDTGAR